MGKLPFESRRDMGCNCMPQGRQTGSP